jgi:hypothetical protein
MLSLALLTPAQGPDPVDPPRTGSRPPAEAEVDNRLKPQATKPVAEIPRVTGTWTIVAAEVAGRAAPIPATTVTIDGNILTFGGSPAGRAAATDTTRVPPPVSRTEPPAARTITSTPAAPAGPREEMPLRWRLDFGAANRIRAYPVVPGPGDPIRAATGTGGATGAGSVGVYVISRDYFVISLDDSYAYKVNFPQDTTAPRTGAGTVGTGGRVGSGVDATGPERPGNRGPFILVLRRSGAGAEANAPAPSPSGR